MIKIKADNGGNNYGYNVSEEAWLAIALAVYQEIKKEQAEKAKEPLKMGGAVSQFLHAYGVTGELDERSQAAGNASAFPEAGGELIAGDWLTAWNHSEGRSGNVKTRQANWDKKAAALIAAGLNPADFLDKRPEAKAV